MIYTIDHIADQIRERILSYTQIISPTLDIVQTTTDFASIKYIENKLKTGEKLGITTRVITPLEMKESKADGIIVQLPVGKPYDEDKLLSWIPREKDVDGFKHLGGIMKNGEAKLEPCTAKGIVQIIDSFFKGKTSGKHVVIINRSNIVGKPLSMMLLPYDCTVSICHSKTPWGTILYLLKSADVVVSAVGKRNFILHSMLKRGALVVDVSINRDKEGKVCGDVCPDIKKASDVWTTPVPRGVGQLTVLNLLENTCIAAMMKSGMI